MTLEERIKEDDELLKNHTLTKYFEAQLAHIKDPLFRDFIERYLNTQPKFKIEKATSSSGKYHPEFQNGYGGNGKHAKNMVKILEVFERAYPNLKWDEIYAAAILHDLAKYQTEDSKWTNPRHPVDEAEEFLAFAKKNVSNKFVYPKKKVMKQFKFVAHLIYWHDGRFNCTYANKQKINENYTKGLLRKMKHAEAFILHSADMLSASRALWSEIF